LDKNKGIKWGPFTLRIPFIHFRFSLSEYLQGVLAGSAAALLLLPFLINWFGLTQDEALIFLFFSTVLIATSPIIFGENLMAGLMTPVFPLVIAFFTPLGLGSHQENLMVMIALSLDFALICFLLGITGTGEKLISLIPNALKSGIILGAAIAALKAVFIDRPDLLINQPIAIFSSIIITIFLANSLIFKRLSIDLPFLSKLTSLGLIPGMLLAGLVGYLTGELNFYPEWRWAEINLPSMIQKVSPLYVGWPEIRHFMEAVPLALIAYVIFFGDLITGNEITKDALDERLDDVQEFNTNRSHLSMSIRNFLSSLFVPFFSYQGILATGPHIVVVNRWRKGIKEMNSIYDGIGSYVSFGFPWFYLVVPLMTALVSFQGIIFAQFMTLTAIGCAQVSMSLVRNSAERGASLFMAVVLVSFPLEPGKALLIGSLVVFLMVGFNSKKK
tara:strand:- start:1475 stop:2806 length:1332 start_codon:yes stop_codon:yes gene_type:complete